MVVVVFGGGNVANADAAAAATAMNMTMTIKMKMKLKVNYSANFQVCRFYFYFSDIPNKRTNNDNWQDFDWCVGFSKLQQCDRMQYSHQSIVE